MVWSKPCFGSNNLQMHDCVLSNLSTMATLGTESGCCREMAISGGSTVLSSLSLYCGTNHYTLQPVAKALETLPYFGLNDLSMILCLWPPLHSYIKVASNTRPCSKLGGTTLNGGRREVSVISHRPVTSSVLKHERLFFVRVSQHFCKCL